MKRLILVLFVAALGACSGGDDGGGDAPDLEPPIYVNLLGTWDYQYTFFNSICDGLSPTGTIQVTSNNGDTSEIGMLILAGNFIGIGQTGNCILEAVYEESEEWRSREAVMSNYAYELYTIIDDAGNNTIVSYQLLIYQDNQILEEYIFDTGVRMRLQLTR